MPSINQKNESTENKFIAAGAYGCVYKHPGLKCKVNKAIPEATISKLIMTNEALSELIEYDWIDNIDDKFLYHYPKPEICVYPE